MILKRVNIRVRGFVQGVFFRHGVKQEAERLNISGWVRNEPDGSVRVVAQGGENQLHKFIAWCRKGTERAHVSSVDVGRDKGTGEFEGFEIIEALCE